MVKNLLQQVVGEDNKLGTAREEMNELIEKINSGYIAKRGPKHQKKKHSPRPPLLMATENAQGTGT
jgi:hypothetical protein